MGNNLGKEFEMDAVFGFFFLADGRINSRNVN
jgi:hypothetical protein